MGWCLDKGSLFFIGALSVGLLALTVMHWIFITAAAAEFLLLINIAFHACLTPYREKSAESVNNCRLIDRIDLKPKLPFIDVVDYEQRTNLS